MINVCSFFFPLTNFTPSLFYILHSQILVKGWLYVDVGLAYQTKQTAGMSASGPQGFFP